MLWCSPPSIVSAVDPQDLSFAATGPSEEDQAALRPDQLAACQKLGIDPQQVKELISKPLYQFSVAEVDLYLRFLHAIEPNIRQRVAHLARKNLGQPYELYLLGELPFEHYDPQPIYCLTKSDCLVFAEHTYAMALGDNWTLFMRFLQRIRYRNGQISVVTRNHYTEVDWNTSNRWLVRDMTHDIAKDRAVGFEQKIDRARFFKNRYHLTIDIPIQTHRDVYLPYEDIQQAKPHLADGDFVNIVRGIAKQGAAPNETFGGSAWVGHVGLIVLGDDGEPHLIHSARPSVREEVLDDYIAAETLKAAELDAAGKARLLGFKFLRLEPDPIRRLQQIDGPDAPKVMLPTGDPMQFQAPSHGEAATKS